MSRLFKALVLFSTGANVACGGSAEPDGSGGSGGAPGGTGGGGPGLETGGSGGSDTASGSSGGGAVFECTPAEHECEEGELSCAATSDGTLLLVGIFDCDCGSDVPTEPADCGEDERLVCGAHAPEGAEPGEVVPAACRCVTATGTDAGDCEAYEPGRGMGVAGDDQEPGAEPLLCGCAYVVLR